MTNDYLTIDEMFDAPQEPIKPSDDYQILLADIIEYEINFLDFPTLVSMVKTQLREQYETYNYDKLVAAHNQIFGGY